MHQRYRTKGIFLTKQDQGEADQSLTIFTPDYGKLVVFGKAIRKITSKLRSGADVFYFSEIEFIQAKHHKTLTDALVIDRFESIRQDPQKLQVAQKIADALDFFITKEEKDEKIWQLVFSVFQKLDTQSLNHSITQSLFYYFLWNLLATLGYSPELHSCPLCEKKLLAETFFFVPQEGGVVCWRCFNSNGLKQGAWFNIQVDTVKILRVWLKEDWEMAGKLRVGAETWQNLLEISENYCNFLQEKFS